MSRIALFLGLLVGAFTGAAFPSTGWTADPGRPAAVYTYHGDNMRTGWNARETLLSYATVQTPGFGKRWSHPVDGQVYAQPLYAPTVAMGAAGALNLVVVATEHNSVYAFNADTGADVPLWQVSLGPSVPSAVVGCDRIGPEYGVTATPVIDPDTGTLYVVAATFLNAQQSYRLHALDIRSGQERVGWPIEIHGSVPGDGHGSVNGQITFDPDLQLQRAGLLLLNGRVLVAFGSLCDASPLCHGWVFSFSASDPAQPPLVFNTTPDAEDPPGPGAGGIWQSGFGLAADEDGNVYFETGNGGFNSDWGGHNCSNSFVRLSTDGGRLTFTPTPANFFTPSSGRLLEDSSLELGSAGAMLLPDQSGTNTPHLLVGAGEDGVIRLLNREFLGGFTGRLGVRTPDNALQDVPNPLGAGEGAMYCGPAYWEGPGGHYLFFIGSRLPLCRFRLGINPNGGMTSWLTADGESVDRFAIGSSPDIQTSTPTPFISSNGLVERTGIVWVLRRDDNTLRAYSAEDLSLLWHSRQVPGDDLGAGVLKFTVPIVVNGKVYVGASKAIVCYGLR